MGRVAVRLHVDEVLQWLHSRQTSTSNSTSTAPSKFRQLWDLLPNYICASLRSLLGVPYRTDCLDGWITTRLWTSQPNQTGKPTWYQLGVITPGGRKWQGNQARSPGERRERRNRESTYIPREPAFLISAVRRCVVMVCSSVTTTALTLVFRFLCIRKYIRVWTCFPPCFCWQHKKDRVGVFLVTCVNYCFRVVVKSHCCICFHTISFPVDLIPRS